MKRRTFLGGLLAAPAIAACKPFVPTREAEAPAMKGTEVIETTMADWPIDAGAIVTFNTGGVSQGFIGADGGIVTYG